MNKVNIYSFNGISKYLKFIKGVTDEIDRYTNLNVRLVNIKTHKVLKIINDTNHSKELMVYFNNKLILQTNKPGDINIVLYEITTHIKSLLYSSLVYEICQLKPTIVIVIEDEYLNNEDNIDNNLKFYKQGNKIKHPLLFIPRRTKNFNVDNFEVDIDDILFSVLYYLNQSFDINMVCKHLNKFNPILFNS